MTRLLILLMFIPLLAMTGGKERQAERDQMVRTQIQARGITHVATLRAMRSVERHKLVPEAQKPNAYSDGPLPIGYGQTISQPYIVAFMTESVRPAKGHKVLEIGTGSGYQAAVLAEIVDTVYTVEIIKELGLRAQKDLKSLKYKNIRSLISDGYHGWEKHAPYDAIVVTAAAEYIPPPLLKQLKDGGTMIIPVGSPFLTQQLVLVEKRKGKIKSRNVMPVRFVPLTRSK